MSIRQEHVNKLGILHQMSYSGEFRHLVSTFS